MKMTNRGGTATFVLLVFVLIFATSLAMAPRAYATSDCIGEPEEVALLWKELYPFGNSDQCMSLCQTWVKTCKSIVSVAADCVLDSFRAGLALEKADCGTLDKSSKKECNRDVRSIRSDFTEFVKEELDVAQAICTNCLEDCVDSCID